MPSDYTRPIETGKITNAKDYIMRCARACNALAFMMDEPLDIPIPEVISTSTYYSDRLSDSKKELEKLKNMNSDDIHKAHVEEIEETCEYFMNSYKESKDKKEKYDAILKQLESWNPTNPSYQKLKEFAIEQIQESCPVEEEYNMLLKAAKKQKEAMDCVPFINTMNNETDEEWYKNAIDHANSSIKRYEQRLEESNARTKFANEWISGLRKSLEEMQ